MDCGARLCLANGFLHCPYMAWDQHFWIYLQSRHQKTISPLTAHADVAARRLSLPGRNINQTGENQGNKVA